MPTRLAMITGLHLGASQIITGLHFNLWLINESHFMFLDTILIFKFKIYTNPGFRTVKMTANQSSLDNRLRRGGWLDVLGSRDWYAIFDRAQKEFQLSWDPRNKYFYFHYLLDNGPQINIIPVYLA